MSDTPETDAAELIYDGIVASGYADVDVCRKLERERDELREKIEVVTKKRDELLGALEAQDKRMKAAGKKCGIPFEVFGCDWPDRVAEELITVVKERYEARTPRSAFLSIYEDGWIGGIQLAIEDTSGSGFRIAGSKFNGSGKLLNKHKLSERDAQEIRGYLDRAFPPNEEITQ